MFYIAQIADGFSILYINTIDATLSETMIDYESKGVCVCVVSYVYCKKMLTGKDEQKHLIDRLRELALSKNMAIVMFTKVDNIEQLYMSDMWKSAAHVRVAMKDDEGKEYGTAYLTRWKDAEVCINFR